MYHSLKTVLTRSNAAADRICSCAQASGFAPRVKPNFSAFEILETSAGAGDRAAARRRATRGRRFGKIRSTAGSECHVLDWSMTCPDKIGCH